MPWKRESLMDQRVKLISDWLSGNYSKSQLSRRHGISRPTVDKWLNRYADRGSDGLKELSRKPHYCPHQTSDELIGFIFFAFFIHVIFLLLLLRTSLTVQLYKTANQKSGLGNYIDQDIYVLLAFHQ